MTNKSYIWPLYNRISHFLMILLFIICYILADFDDLLSYHAIFGYLLGVVFLFRIFWGVVGSKYSRFIDFDFNKTNLKQYLLSPFAKTKEYIGHNPASSYAIVAMILLTFLSILSGALAYGAEENYGLFATLEKNELFEDIHELVVNLFIIVLIAHIIGALVDKYMKKNDAIDSMIDGYKTTSEDNSIKLNIFQKLFTIISLGCFLYAIYYLVFITDNIFIY